MAPTFSIAEFFLSRVDGKWEVHKDAGNQFFKESKYESAITYYTDALFIASGFELSVPFLIKELQTHKPTSSAMYKFSQIAALSNIVCSFLSLPWVHSLNEDIKLRTPNLAAAICLSNRSISYMLLYKQRKIEDSSPEEKLRDLLIKSRKDANKARKMCPTYVKGHHRYAEAQKLLGKMKEHDAVQKEISDYSKLMASGLKEFASAFALGWIEVPELEMYSHFRRQTVYKQILSNEVAASSVVSLVPLSGGQFLTSSLSYIDKDWVKKSEEQLHVSLLDVSNGSDLELPPNGHPSPERLKIALRVIVSFFFELLEEAGVVVQSLMLGQGLVGKEAMVKESLREVLDEQKLASLYVYSSASTYASELASGIF